MNLKEMTVSQAVRMAKELSGKTGKEIARRLGLSPGVIMRYLKEDDDYSPRMGMIPDLCLVLGNDILLKWLEVRIREKQEKRKEKMLLHVAKMEKAWKDMKLLLATEEAMTAEDEEEIRDLITKMERECRRLIFLLPSAPHGSASRKEPAPGAVEGLEKKAPPENNNV